MTRPHSAETATYVRRCQSLLVPATLGLPGPNRPAGPIWTWRIKPSDRGICAGQQLQVSNYLGHQNRQGNPVRQFMHAPQPWVVLVSLAASIVSRSADECSFAFRHRSAAGSGGGGSAAIIAGS
jgi:hypothetical protein